MTNFKTTDEIKKEWLEIEIVNQYKYLEQTIVMEERTANDMQLRIRSVFGRYKEILPRKGNTYVLEKKSLQPVYKPNTDIWMPNLDTHKISSPED